MASLLIVDDNELNRDLIKRRLSRDGHEIDLAEDGQTAINLLKTKVYDLVFLDIEMPVMNGIETLRHIKHDPQTKNNIIVMLTAHNDIELVKRCLQLGAVDYLTKPFDMSLVKKCIANLSP
ncbi:MAG: hypothetical protein DIZ80_08580 [endosymbiont of Galathealinum brachiosum]|uniref:Response regulatory domain-containing protein n=1 Tax=endosymbiont of Galathealinum brachiosum TaxID=2200906 RepID=A0A370DBU1_9GAMM|nr:MAG: hypothetical protein DIZ80_08580 [endosymbiont of Galathealinum brachiosum]